MDKKAFLSVLRFMKAKPWLILGMIGAMLLVTFGEQKLSDILLDVELKYADYGLAVIRLILQTVLSVVLVYAWHKDKNEAAPFAAVDILKLFVTTLILYTVIICAVSVALVPLGIGLLAQNMTAVILFGVIAVLLIPPAIWVVLRIDFFMNTYITGRSNGILSCIGASFRITKKKAGRYLLFNIKYLAFFFVIEIAVSLLSVIPGQTLSDGMRTALNVFDAIFASVFMPYIYLIKCGFYDEVLTDGQEA